MGYDKRIAVFAGTFDPVTVGHTDIISRAAELFDEVHVVIAFNRDKQYKMFSPEERLEMIRASVNELPCRDRIVCAVWDRPVFEYCEKAGAKYIVKGVRSAADFDYEKILARQTDSLFPGIETVLLFAKSEYEHISSTYVRGCIDYDFDLDGIVPQPAIDIIIKSEY